MPVKRLMSWDKQRKRWYKKYRREDGAGLKIYTWNPEEGNYPRTKEDSLLAANCWWEAKQRDIDAKLAARAVPPPNPVSLTVATLVDRAGGVDQLRRDVAELEAKRRLLDLLERSATGEAELWAGDVAGPLGQPIRMTVSGPDARTAYDAARLGQPLRGVDEALTTVEGLDWPAHALDDGERADRLADIGSRLAGSVVAADRTVKTNVEAWVETTRLSAQAGAMSLGRWDRYARDIRAFSTWAGEDKDVSVINAALLEKFWMHLQTEMNAERTAPATARHALMTLKQFIGWAAGRDVIPLPKNIRERRLSIHVPEEEVESFEAAEVKAILKAAKEYSERTYLFVLMMVNCGMYPNDISSLRFDQWDREAGTITRFRSKTKKAHAKAKRKKVTWRLWPETQEMLVKYAAASGDRVLVNERGQPLVAEKVEGQQYRHYNCIANCVKKLKDVVKVRLPLKCFRKTSASLLESDGSPEKGWGRYFLAQASADVAERSYIRPDQNPFFRALAWLRSQYLD